MGKFSDNHSRYEQHSSHKDATENCDDEGQFGTLYWKNCAIIILNSAADR